MQKLRSGFGLFVGVLALSGGMAVGQRVRSDVKASARQAEQEFDPDAGSEAPLDAEQYEGEVAVVVNGCEPIGGFSTTFIAAQRYRGNLYSITDSGVFLKEIKMQLAFTGTANLFVSVHRKLPDNSYVEVDINPSPTQGYLFVPTPSQGVNAAFYPSGEINGGAGVELTPGTYAIGFSWGPESVKYGRDSSTYPRAMEVGSTLASVSRELTVNEPPLPAILPSLTQFTGGAYAQQLCFVPTEGACCRASTQTCVDVLEAECTGEGSFFHGQRTTCKDTICEFGACCFECDIPAQNFAARCGDNYVAESCDLAGGIQFWSEVSCPGDESVLCPKLVGACCNGTTCNLKCETECLAGGGSYEGDGTNCDPNTHVCKGACCVTGGCFDRTQSGCAGSNGTFRGRGTRCFSEDCGGACCYGFTGLDFCEVFDERTLCAYDPEGFPKIVYRGDGTTCPLDGDCGPETQYKACCLPEGQCINTTQAVCTAPWIQGNFISTGTCATIAPEQCTNILSRCCFNDGSCEVLTGNACTARSGTPVVGQNTCAANVCNSVAGACCQPGVGECTMKSATQCNAEGGFYQGDDTDCSAATTTCPGFGSCCRGNGECLEDQTQSQCTILGGAYGGAGSACATQQCDQRGACCAITGTCLLTTAGTCVGIEGDFKGVGVQCAPGVCLSGACCLPVDGCKKRTKAACEADSGDYIGNNASCASQNCIVQGGCCRADVCTVEQPEQCAVNAGTYLGNGTACGANACVSGACCRIAGTCEDGAEQGGCAGPGEAFHAGLACSSVQCTPQGACCNGTTCTTNAEAACSSSGGTYKGDGVACGANTCPATGACCNGTLCATATQSDCLSGGGEYKGDNSICDANTCPAPTGACCDGQNCTITTLTVCTSGGGEYKGDNIICDVNTCPAPATGACCNGQDCTITTQAECSGTYQNDGSLCSSNPCQAAQCTAITGTVPANCAVDARRPNNPNTPTVPEGWNFIDLTFDCDTANHTKEDYSVTVLPIGTPPTVLLVTPTGNTIKLDLSGPIPPGAWTCFTYLPASLTKCLGFLPGDVSGNRATAPADILDLIDHLNGVRVPALVISQCDMDRSNFCAPADILTLIDLLNGTNSFASWNGKSLPACPAP